MGEGQTGRLLFARLDAARGFRPGDFVTVEIREPALDDVAVLPASAVDAADSVLVLGEEDRLEEEPVEVLRRQGDSVLVRAGALAGREVVAAPHADAGRGHPGAARVRRRQRAGRVRPPASRAATPEMIALDDERRARLIAFVEGNDDDAGRRQGPDPRPTQQPEVPAAMIERLEGRMGG